MLTADTHIVISPKHTKMLGEMRTHLQSTPQELVDIALDAFFAAELKQRIGIQEAIAQADEGLCVDADEVFAEFLRS